MTLSPEYEKAYDNLLGLLGTHCEHMPDLVCCHWPMHQPSYDGGLLLIGQALNGWVVEAKACDLTDPSTRTTTLEDARRFGEGPTAFKWMSPRVRTRPFWKLADVAMSRIGTTLDRIAWSNLAKVAPATGRNPQRELLWSQHRLGGPLLRAEVEELAPRLVLVISGRAYTEPFLRSANVRPDWARQGALEFAGLIEGRAWLVVSHPGTFAARYEASHQAIEHGLTELGWPLSLG